MGTKTITVTDDAYEALKGMKEDNESFSKTILRISGKRSLREFVGALSPESADKLKKAVDIVRKRNDTMYREKIKKIISGLEG